MVRANSIQHQIIPDYIARGFIAFNKNYLIANLTADYAKRSRASADVQKNRIGIQLQLARNPFEELFGPPWMDLKESSNRDLEFNIAQLFVNKVSLRY